jgi:hypothetical protein
MVNIPSLNRVLNRKLCEQSRALCDTANYLAEESSDARNRAIEVVTRIAKQRKSRNARNKALLNAGPDL